MIALNPYTLTLDQTSLIEASAGTGKTYTITSLAVRLIATGFPIESILVVTFTEAAAAELKLRIRSRLVEVLAGLEARADRDDDLLRYLSSLPDPNLVKARIAHSLTCFDQAAVMTIHSFCYKILREHAFESGAGFDLELAPDSAVFKRQVCMDFFMTRISNLDPLDLNLLAQQGVTPDNFLKEFRLVLSGKDLDTIPEDGQFEAISPDYKKTARRIFDLLKTEKQAIIDLLREHKGLNKRSYTKKYVPAWLDQAMEKFEQQGDTAFFVMEEKGDSLYKFTNTRLSEKTDSGPAPAHEFFDLCQDLLGLYRGMAKNLEGLRLEFLRFYARELATMKDRTGTCFFDDLVNDLAAALAGPARQQLIAAVRETFQACLIDEFQDTDPRQYAIFSALFSKPDTQQKPPFFMIGDPKQAIYAFRGGDIFAYLTACQDSDQMFTLDKNYRSSPLLVQAVNAVFSLRERPFIFKDIEFTPVGTPTGAIDLLNLQEKAVPPLQIDFIPRQEAHVAKNGLVRKDHAVKIIPSLLGRQILQDLASPLQIRGKKGETRAPGPGDMAVLVRTNDQAEDVRNALSELNIPCFVSRTGSVFDAVEAQEFYTLLCAVDRPDRTKILKAALATSVFGFRARDLIDLDKNQTELIKWQDRFAAYKTIWETRGIAAMFTALFHSEDREDRRRATLGERGITNFYHLMELSSGAEQNRRLSRSFLLKWLEHQLSDQTRDETADELRLESDEKAVAIVTIHKSKGLEYPLVYLPYLWAGQGGSSPGKGPVLFHDPDLNNRLRLDLRVDGALAPDGPDAIGIQRSRDLRAMEEEAEDRRLLYVALTRASAGLRILWGGFAGVETSALGNILHTGGCAEDQFMLSDLKAFETASPDCVTIQTMAEPDNVQSAVQPWAGASQDKSPLSARTITRTIAPQWRISSFSAMISQEKDKGWDTPAGDGEILEEDTILEGETGAPGPRDPGAEIPLKDFPKGAAAGDFFHAVLEELDFAAPGTAVENAVLSNLEKFGFTDPKLFAPTVQAIQDILSAPLETDSDTFCLKDITRENRFSELAFVFSVKDFKTPDFINLFETHGRFKSYPALIKRLSPDALNGYIKGFIDLVVRHRGKWYILDYKSNFLGPAYADYNPAAMAWAMLEHHYILQYHIYLLALDRYLKLRLKDYDYSKDFGGVCYLFIRGMHPRHPGAGIFYDRPSPELAGQLMAVPGKEE